jgi:hypothetical protein
VTRVAITFASNDGYENEFTSWQSVQSDDTELVQFESHRDNTVSDDRRARGNL